MSIWLATLPIDLIRRQDRRRPSSAESRDDRAILLAARDGAQMVTAHACRRAMDAGVRPGMPISEARALLPAGKVRIEPFAPERISRALRALAMWSERYSPQVAMDEPDGLLIDVTGSERVFRGEDRLLKLVRRDFTKLGLGARAAIAPTFGCAWAIARFAQSPLARVGADDIRRALAPLPIKALRSDEATIAGLAEVGVERIEELLALPRAALPARFGPALLMRLDQALGQAIEVIEPVRPIHPPRAHRVFDGATDRWEPIALTVRELLDELAKTLATLEAGAQRLEVTLTRSDLPPVRLAISMSRPSRDPKHLWALLEPRLERAHLGFGVEEIEIVIFRWARLPHEQQERWRSAAADAASDRDVARLIDTLANRLGEGRVLKAEIIESHLPERACRMMPFETERKGARKIQAAHARIDRPALLFRRPIPIEVIAVTPDGPIHRISCQGESRDVISTIGPERLAPEWWPILKRERKRATRDYFKVQDADGRWLWVCREHGAGAWFIHGMWA